MDNWTELVKTRMRELKITQEKLAEQVGVTQGAVGHWLREEREPKLRVLNQILVAVQLPPLRIAYPDEIRDEPGLYGVGVAPMSVTGADGQRHELYFRYPIAHWDSLDEASVPEDCARQSTDYKAQGRGFWLRVEGDAMTAPVGLSVPTGMLILVDTGVNAEPGKLLIVRMADSTVPMFRQLIEEGGQRFLKPLNPTYPKTLFTDQCEVVGVVVQALITF